MFNQRQLFWRRIIEEDAVLLKKAIRDELETTSLQKKPHNC
jgi:hypothetical protein